MAEAERVLRELAAAGMTREDHVVALGGGVVGDLAGFCAHLYQRGVPVVQVPTTLVAQVDSAYGGKTGVDLPEGKNYAGAYHLPAAVLADTATLATLPREELAAGFVEVLKTGLLAGGALWERVRAIEALDPAELDDVVFACARYKCEVVAADERDAGLRAVLNLGHTVGHAIEAASGYERYRHGEAVGLGLLAALRLSEAPELREEVEAILRRHDLPVRARRRRSTSTRSSRRCSATRSGPPTASASSSSPSPASPATGQLVDPDRVRAAVEELRRMTATRNRVAVLHGVNFDILDRRDPEVYGGLSLSELEHADRRLGARAGARTDLLPDQPRGRVRRVPAPAARPRRRGADQRRRLDPLQPRDRRRARRRRAARGRGPPLRRRVARRLAQGLGLRRPGAGEDLRQGPGRLPRGARAARPASSAPPA